MNKILIIIALFAISTPIVYAKETAFRDGMFFGMIHKLSKRDKPLSPKKEYEEPVDNILRNHYCVTNDDTKLVNPFNKNNLKCEVTVKSIPLSYANWFFIIILALFCLNLLVVMGLNVDENFFKFLIGFIIIKQLT
jgi:hypothetical protein